MVYLLAEKLTLRWRFAGFGWISESSVGCMWSEESMGAEKDRRVQKQNQKKNQKKRISRVRENLRFLPSSFWSFFSAEHPPSLSLSLSLCESM